MKAAIRSCPLPCWLKRSRRNRLFPRKPISRIKGNVHAVDIVHCLGHASSLQKPSGRISAGLCSVREFPKSVWTAATMKSQSSAMDYMVGLPFVHHLSNCISHMNANVSR